jgi:hypothetical protein
MSSAGLSYDGLIVLGSGHPHLHPSPSRGRKISGFTSIFPSPGGRGKGRGRGILGRESLSHQCHRTLPAPTELADVSKDFWDKILASDDNQRMRSVKVAKEGFARLQSAEQSLGTRLSEIEFVGCRLS